MKVDQIFFYTCKRIQEKQFYRLTLLIKGLKQ